MKKFLVIFLSLLILTACKEGYQQPDGTVSDMIAYQGLETEQFYDLSVESFLELVEDKKTIIAYFGRSDCHICNQLVPILNNVSIDKDMKLYYVDMDKSENISNMDNIDKIRQLGSSYFDSYGEEYETFPIPCVIYIKKGKVNDIHIGTVVSLIKEEELTDKQEERLRYNLEKEFDGIIE